ncbi:MAG: hypothetical protein AAGE96_15405 [Cyanobacteria bacterium P01_G01_bin.19]
MTQAKSLTNPYPLMVEFVGLPGSGKTTLSNLVAFKLESKGIKIVSREEILKQWHQKKALSKLFKLFTFNSNQWNILRNSLTFAAQVKPINLQSFLRAGRVFVNVKRNDDLVRARNCQIILLEQGLLQTIWSIVITGSLPQFSYPKRTMVTLFDHRSIAIVNCKLDLNTAVSRIKNRPRKKIKDSYFDLMDSKQVYDLLTKYCPYLQEIINWVKTEEIPMLEVDSSLTLEENSEKIANWIVSQLGANYG